MVKKTGQTHLTNAQDLSRGPGSLSETEGPRWLDVSIANHST
jgi:hypothetical protein